MASNVTHTSLLAVMPEGIGDLTFASEEWVDYARDVLEAQRSRYASQLADLEPLTICEVGINPPAYLRCGDRLAWWARISGDRVDVGCGELAKNECDFKVTTDHSVISNIARIQFEGSDPVLVADAQARLRSLARWEIHGGIPEHPALAAILRSLHDLLGKRTMPRFVFMTPEWVSTVRHFLTARATSEKYADALSDIVFTFSEEFTNTPAYAFPDGTHGGFWVNCNRGHLTVGAGPLPAEYGPADMLTKGAYTPVVPIGRTVNVAMTDEDLAELDTYRKAAFRFDKAAGKAPIEMSSPSGAGEMPHALARVFVPLHDELAKRTSGELPADFVEVKENWRRVQAFDRDPSYDANWLRYDKVDIYGNPRD